MVSRFPNQNKAIAFSELGDFDFEDGHNVDMPQAMKHRTVDYNVEEVEPGWWRWIIYPPGPNHPRAAKISHARASRRRLYGRDQQRH
jgi:hypothetical protein